MTTTPAQGAIPADWHLRAKVADLLHLLKGAHIECPSVGDLVQAQRTMGAIRAMLSASPAAPETHPVSATSEARIPFGWARSVVTPDTPMGCAEYDVDMHYGEDRPNGDGWVALYTERAAEAPQEAAQGQALPELKALAEISFNAVWACPHRIDSEVVALLYDPKKPGHNALNQLHRRIMDALTAALAQPAQPAQAPSGAVGEVKP